MQVSDTQTYVIAGLSDLELNSIEGAIALREIELSLEVQRLPNGKFSSYAKLRKHYSTLLVKIRQARTVGVLQQAKDKEDAESYRALQRSFAEMHRKAMETPMKDVTELDQ